MYSLDMHINQNINHGLANFKITCVLSFRHFSDNSPALLCIVMQIEQRTPFSGP